MECTVLRLNTYEQCQNTQILLHVALDDLFSNFFVFFP